MWMNVGVPTHPLLPERYFRSGCISGQQGLGMTMKNFSIKQVTLFFVFLGFQALFVPLQP